MMKNSQFGKSAQRGMSNVALVVTLLVSVLAGGLLFGDGPVNTKLLRSLGIGFANMSGAALASAVEKAGDEVGGGLHKVPVERNDVVEGVYQVTGLSSFYLINTSEGSVLFDTGIALQGAKSSALMKEAMGDRPLKYVVYSHAHTDHVGGLKFWLDEIDEGDAKIIAHREFPEEQRYLASEVSGYQMTRNAKLFVWLPNFFNPDGTGEYLEPLTGLKALFIEGFGYLAADPQFQPDIVIDAQHDYKFELGGQQFEVLNAPGAEGADGVVMWMPQKKLLFTGDLSGPYWPQFPNIFTMRGEKIRKPYEYYKSLEKVAALKPEVLVNGHDEVQRGGDYIYTNLLKMRDAVKYVHDETIKGMNAGKTVHQLMDDISLPEDIAVKQTHGNVSWGVRHMWEYYATWMHLDSTAEMYPLHVREVYADLADLAGSEALLVKAQAYLDQGDEIRAIYNLEVGLAAEPENRDLLQAYLEAHEQLLEESLQGLANTYNNDYLRYQIRETEAALGMSEDA